MLRKTVACLGLTVLVIASCLPLSAFSADKDIALPKPKAALNADLMQAFRERRSTRDFAKKDIPLEDIATLLWAGYGINRPDGKRTVPSAHGKDAIALYALLDSGVYRYDPKAHALESLSRENIKGRIAGQGFVAGVPLVIVIVGKSTEFSGSAESKAGYVNFTAGSAAENIYLAAGALGLGTVTMASVNRDVLTKSLKLKGGDTPLYIMPVGYPK